MIPANRYRASRKVDSIARQRMVKNGSQNIGGPNIQVTSWTPDSTWPGTIVSNELVVVGSGSVNVIAPVRGSTFTIAWTMTVVLKRNGTTVDTETFAGSVVTKDLTWSGTVADGDVFRLEASIAGGQQGTVGTTITYIDVNPA